MACSSNDTEITKCDKCVWIICKSCLNNWHIRRSDNKCMHCRNIF